MSSNRAPRNFLLLFIFLHFLTSLDCFVVCRNQVKMPDDLFHPNICTEHLLFAGVLLPAVLVHYDSLSTRDHDFHWIISSRFDLHVHFKGSSNPITAVISPVSDQLSNLKCCFFAVKWEFLQKWMRDGSVYLSTMALCTFGPPMRCFNWPLEIRYKWST